jgi:hypothetical protein
MLVSLLISGLVGASNLYTTKNLLDASACTEIVTLYRCRPDGVITPVNVSIVCEEGESVEEAMAKKCDELFDKDILLQSYVFGGNMTNISVFSRVRSSGVGHHWRSPWAVRIPYPLLLRYRIFLRLPIIYKLLGIYVSPLVVGNYSNDEKASTKIELVYMPYRPSNETISIKGKHTVWAFGFVGYIGWLGMNAEFIDERGWSTLFYGYASAVYCKQFS